MILFKRWFRGGSDTASIGHNNLVLGSDEEKALTNAIQSVFPNSTLVLCTRHLEENVKRYIQAKSGSEMLKHRIVSDIFGTNGLLHANDATHFDAESNRLLETYLELIPDFVNYFKTKLVPLLKQHVFLPNKENNFVPLNWKNNSCESMNHILKLTCNWKPQKLLDLINKIYQIVQSQYSDVRRALYENGNYQLSNKFVKYRLSYMDWKSKTSEEKETIFKKFMKVCDFEKKENDKSYIFSTDGEVKIPKTPTTARKPGQRKRIRNDKTRSVSKKRKI